VYFFEDSDDYPACYDPGRNVMDTDPSYGLEFAARAFERLGLETRWTYYDAHRQGWLGPAADRALELCRTADVVLNVSCVNPLRTWMSEIPVRVLVDTDPLFTQVRHLNDPAARAHAMQHTAFCSYGENIGQSGCAIPPDGLPWFPTRQPIVLDEWTPTPGRIDDPLSTIMLWDSYPSVEHNGKRFGMKAESFGPYLDLPRRSGQRFTLALGARSPVQQQLASHGWTIVDPRERTRDPWSYHDFIRGSKAEFSVAKHGYVVSQSGWFSERSAGYLARGRPVVVQDTGFSRWLDADGGVLWFRDDDEALTQLEALNRSYDRQCAKARRVAERYFESSHVLTRLLDDAMTASQLKAAPR